MRECSVVWKPARCVKSVRLWLFAAAAMDHGSADCLLVAVMTHGETGLLHSRDTVYQIQELWLHFTGDKCHSLIGKPKLFFIQVKQRVLTYSFSVFFFSI
jgi:hypothetical protein